MALFTRLLGRFHQCLAKLRAQKESQRVWGSLPGKVAFYTGILTKCGGYPSQGRGERIGRGFPDQTFVVRSSMADIF